MNEKEKKILAEERVDEKGNKVRETCVDFNPMDKTQVNVFTKPEKPISADPYDKHQFNFDYVFDCDTQQVAVYEVAAKPIIESILDGFNGTVLAYGQTSSGKTFTMQGILHSDELQGIIPRMVETVFEKINEAKETMEFMVKSAMIEIYNEKIRDLLDPSKNNLNVHEDKQKGIYVDGLTEESIAKAEEVYDIIERGNSNRAIAATNMNANSSRSHSIFIMSITMNDLENMSCKTGKLYLVDLAGSEVISKTGATGSVLEEAKNINKSLTMLGRVINALTDGKSTFIPYRDSKLTRILQESLGGNSKTCLIITASPSMYNAVETLSTCRFGMRAKSIKNNAKINKQLTVAELSMMVKKLQKELELSQNRIKQLEVFIIGLGGTIPPEDENFVAPKDLEETKSSTTEDSNKDDGASPSPHPQEEGKTQQSESPFAVAAGEAAAPKKEEVKTVTNEVVKVVMNSGESKMLENQLQQMEAAKKESAKELEMFINQLKQERKKVKVKEMNLQLMKNQMAEKDEEIEKLKRENKALVQNAVEYKITIQQLEDKLKEAPLQASTGIALSKSVSATIAAVSIQPNPANLQQAEVAGAAAQPHLVPAIIPAKPVLALPAHEPTSPGKKTYSEQEMQRLVSEAATKEKKSFEEGKAKLLKKHEEILRASEEQKRANEELRKMNEDLKKKLQAKEDDCKALESFGKGNDSDKIKSILVLERNLKQLHQMYHQLLQDKAEKKVTIEMNQKQIKRLTGKIDEKDSQIANAKAYQQSSNDLIEKMKEFIKKNVENGAQIVEAEFSQTQATYSSQSNVIRPLKGGGGRRPTKFATNVQQTSIEEAEDKEVKK